MPRIGRYELLRLLGRGGMAEVFLARRRGPGGVEKQLAVKRIRPERSGDPRFLEMFVTEARLSMSMAHKNIVQVFDFGRAGDQLFLVMEYIDGVDLGAALAALRTSGREPGTLDPLLAAFIGMEACQALDHAYRTGTQRGHGIVHRDVTPRNVLLSRAGEVKLVDFGVATAVTDLGRAGRVRGTPAYMSPEQARGQGVDGRSDVFSLGLVLWEALAGRRAYTGEEPRLVLDVARAAEVPPLDDDVPDELREIVARATARDPEERFADARAMQLALDGFVISARAIGRGQPPSHRIASWVEELSENLSRTVEGDGPDELDDAGDAAAVSGTEVVTFLDDGEELSESLGMSTAITLGDTGSVPAILSDPSSASEPEPESEPESASEPESEPAALQSRARSRGWFLGGLVAFMALGLGLWGLQSGSDRAPLPSRALDASTTPKTTATLLDAGSAPYSFEPLDAMQPGSDTETALDASAQTPVDDAAPEHHQERPDAPITTGKNPGSRTRPGPPATTEPPGETREITETRGTVKISATPWARVTVARSSASCDETPCVLSLSAGRHTLRLVNPVADLRKDVTVTVEAGKTIVVNTRLTSSEP